jgi:hypothetical protein
MENIHIAPFYYVNEVQDEVKPNNDFNKQLFQKLREYDTGMDLIFSLASTDGRRTNPPQSLAEAIRVCQNEEANYLLYGYVAYREYTINAEVKLLDYQRRSIIHIFYAVDDLDNLDRLLSDLTTKILAFVEKTFNLKILEHEPQFTELRVYGNLGYWTPVGSRWIQLLIGAAMIDFGIRFIPTDQLQIYQGYTFYGSMGFDVSYQFGVVNPDRYEGFSHTVTIGLPLKLHMKLNAQHEVSGGIGLLYSFDFLQIKLPYEDGTVKLFRGLGMSFILGYSFRFQKYFSLTTDNYFELKYYEVPSLTYSLRIGVDYRFFRQEVIRKW